MPPVATALALVPAVKKPTADPLQLLHLVLDAVHSAESKRAYGRGLADFIAWCQRSGHAPFIKATVQAYKAELTARGLAKSTVNVRLSAIRKLAAEASDNNLLPPEIAAGIARVKNEKALGLRTGNWLTGDQAEQLLAAPDISTLKGKRDRALLALLVGCGLAPRAGRIDLWADPAARQPLGRCRPGGQGWPAADRTHARLVENRNSRWATAAGIFAGRVFRSVTKIGALAGDGISTVAVFKIVSQYAAQIGLQNIAPHDLRRTFAKLARKGNAPLEQIQMSLGHSSIQTTERYLGVRQDFHDAPCDRLGLRPGAWE